MSGRLGKDERAALIAEFEQGKASSNPNYYCVKDKNGKVMIRKVRAPKEPLTEEETEYAKMEKAVKVIQQSMGKIAQMRPRPSTPVPEKKNNNTPKEPKPQAL